jgi:hypothetical protein
MIRMSIVLFLTAALSAGAENAPPTISFTAPAEGAVFMAPGPITLSAEASDSDGIVKKVQFLVKGNSVGTAKEAPYNFTWKNVMPGKYKLAARVTDDGNAQTTSDPVNVTVTSATDGLMNYWKFDDGDGTAAKDSGPRRKDGRLDGKGGWGPGKYGGALHFPEDGGPVFIQDPALTVSAITMAVWVKHETVTRSINIYALFGHEAVELRHDGVHSPGELHFFMKDHGKKIQELRVKDAIVAGEWIHVAGAVDGNTMYLYKNAELIASAPAVGAPMPMTFAFIMGLDGGDSFQGSMDDFFIYDRALSANELKTVAFAPH